MNNYADGDKDRLIEELRAAIAARDEFIAVAAHELRNPVTPIVAQAQLLKSRAQREGVSESLMRSIDTLQLAVDHYVRRATTLLEISRLNAGRLRLQLSTFDVCASVRDCARNYEQMANHAGSQIEVDVPAELSVHWDRLAIDQVLDNLVSNAVRYGDGEPIKLAVEHNDARVIIRVIDQGIGIAAEDQPRIFDRFERAVGNTTRGGFGIGLWLANKLVRAHGGSLAVDSTVGVGSEFIVSLPRRASDDDLLGADES